MRIVVTGGAGFIGSRLVERLVADGHAVRVVDSLIRGSRRNLKAAAFAGARLYEVDVRSPDLRDVVMGDHVDVLIHLAGRPNVRASLANPVADALENLTGTLNVLEAARLAGVGRVVIASSAAVYGVPDRIPATEDMDGVGRSPYGIAMRAVHDYASFYRAIHRMETVPLVLANVYGPRQDPDDGVVPRFLSAHITGRSAPIHGTGLQTRDFVFLDDVVEAFVLALERGGPEPINIGTGIETSVLQLWQACRAITGSDREPEGAPRVPGEPERLALDWTRARDTLEWEPTTPLTEGLAITAAWMREHLCSDAGPLSAALARAEDAAGA